VNLEAAALSLGRDANCSVVLDDEEVSGQHAVIERNGDNVGLRDLGSANGTRVNDEAIEKKNLKHGDVIQVGQTRLFVEARRPTHAGGLHGIQVLNHILLVIAFVGAPVAFIFLVAYLEDVYLGVNRASLKRMPVAEEDKMALTRALAVAPQETPAEPGWLLTNREEKSSIPLAGGTAWVEDTKKPRRVARAIKIAGVEETLLAESGELQEMRVVEVRLAREPVRQELTPESVRVDVSMFDRDAKTGDITLTDARVAKGPLKPEGAWGADESKSVKATYVVRKDAQKTGIDSARTKQYFGYVVRLYYHDKLQDESARPQALLKYSPVPANGDEASGSMEISPASSPSKADAGSGGESRKNL